ncbi:MAG TPA: NAD(P)-dependent oxidoreductase [Gaiellales bacterium]|nr:NAD(P)-dependent oxidoreductase [Gaiellales bacterium]
MLVCDPTYPMGRVREILPDATGGELGDGGADTEALLVSPAAPVAAAAISRMPALRVIATASTGTDHIDLEAAAGRGIAVRAVSDYCTEEVADHALALIVGLLRGVPAGMASVQRGGWDFRAGGTPRRIAGSRLALLGYGRIGRATGDRARALGMEVRFHDPFVEGSEDDLDGLLAWADAVSLHMPLTEGTRGILDERRLALMRPETALVNTARGSLVDRAAMIAATHLRAAFDNVWEQPPGDDLLGLDHLAITPYMAWFSAQTEWLPYLRAAESAAALLADQRS